MFKEIKRTELVRFSMIFTAIVLAAGCANVVAPQGGPKDEDPPEVIRSEPANFSTNYDGSDVRIFFDEYIELRNLRQKMLVSPPMKDLPEVRIRRRSIIMSIEEELMENTTYNFFFGDAIRDITEGNAIPNFQFVLSTGDYVDSLSVRGKVIDAFDLKPAEGVFVMMYDNIYDSVPYKELPVYISRTDDQGRFVINNMRKGEYFMFALKDLNYNFIFDQPDEKIAFLDSLVVPEYLEIIEEPDNGEEDYSEDEELPEPIMPEAEGPETEFGEPGEDSFFTEDDTSFVAHGKAEAEFYRLLLFKEKDTVQRVSSVNFTHPGKLSLAFRIPFDSVFVEEYKHPFDHDWKLSEFSKNKDSLHVWFADVERDSLFLKVVDRGQVIDTLKRSIKPREDRRGVIEEPLMTLTTNRQPGRHFPFFKQFVLTANNPVKEAEIERIKVIKNDSIPVESAWKPLGRAGRGLLFDKELEQETSYKFIIPDSTITDIFGLVNKDTLQTSFTTSAYEDYGVIMLNLTLPSENEHFIIQLMDGQGKILEEKHITTSGEYLFHHLLPGNYGFKVIHDKNNNGKWDTGNYLKGIQPEPVFVLDEKVNVRQNWEHEVVWRVE